MSTPLHWFENLFSSISLAPLLIVIGIVAILAIGAGIGIGITLLIKNQKNK